jgi:DNA-binding NarL/FixJ family response regulator
MNKIKIAIADDQVLFLRGLKFIIQSFDDVELVIEANDGQDLLNQLEQMPADVILCDVKMPNLDGIETTKIIKTRYPNTKVILLTMYNDDRLISHAMEIGAHGYLLKEEESEEVHRAIKEVYEKGHYFNDYVSQALLKQVKNKNKTLPTEILGNMPVKLTRREMEVLELICKEFSTTEIANQLFLSARTVEGHRKNLLEKTGVKNTAGLVVFAIKNELVSIT